MYQKITLVGNLGADPEMRYMANGDPVTNFSLATNRRWTDGGETKEETCWFRVSAFRSLAKNCNEYLSKGRQVLVEGRLRPGQDGNPAIWSGQDGTARSSYEVVAESVRFLGGGEGGRQDVDNRPARGNPNKEQDEIPF